MEALLEMAVAANVAAVVVGRMRWKVEVSEE